MYKNNIKDFKGYYTGVGSRETPLHVLYLMSKISMIMEKQGYILRSGCATGADSAFEDILLNPKDTAEIYIPNRDFPERMGTKYKEHYIIPMEKYGKGQESLYRKATNIIHTNKIHKMWEVCNPRIMDLHNRNMFQVLGKDLATKSKFNICYTSGGEKKYEDTNQGTGGTATAINASDFFGVVNFNLGNKEDYKRLNEFVTKFENIIDYEVLHDMVVRSSLNNQRLPYKDLFRKIKNEEKARFSDLSQEGEPKRRKLFK